MSYKGWQNVETSIVYDWMMSTPQHFAKAHAIAKSDAPQEQERLKDHIRSLITPSVRDHTLQNELLEYILQSVDWYSLIRKLRQDS